KAPLSGNLRGRSLKPLLEGAGHFPARVFYAEAMYGQLHFGWAGLASTFDGRHRYIQAPRDEVYDVSADPRGQRPLSPADDLRHTLKAALADIAGPARPSADADGPDPKDEYTVLESFRRGKALAADRNWADAVGIFQQIVHDRPNLAEVWG